MPRPDFSDITVILDRSGSMESIRDDTIGGFNRFLGDQQEAPGDAVLTLVQFDNLYEVPVATWPISGVNPLTRQTFVPRGSTSLLDAIGRGVDEAGARFAAMPEHARPAKVLFIIITDGHENSSNTYTTDRVFSMIRHQREVYAWEFLFLGANQDAIASAARMGMDRADAMTFAADGDGTVAAFAATARVARGRRGGMPEQFSEGEREAQRR